MFGPYLAPNLARDLIAESSGAEFETKAAERELTPFFLSIHGYVGLAEQVPLAQLSQLLSAYFEACSAPIEEESGCIDKYIGDAVVAMFGAPVELRDHALRACNAALKCHARIAALRVKFQSEGTTWPAAAHQLRIRIGLNTGRAIVGMMGTRTRFSYTMMGDSVNLAARLESAAKAYGVWTLCTGATRDAAEQSRPGFILFRSLGPIIVKGRAEPVEIFEPMAFADTATAQQQECVRTFEAALAHYLRHDWAAAVAGFQQSARLEADQPEMSPEIKTNPSLVFLDLALAQRENFGASPGVR
ncbi:MAG: adenylate/guanylate cyclase domain-containing protein [Verrucomicrobiota bacterium]